MLAGVLWLTAVADVRAQGMRSPLGDGAGSPHACWGEQILASPDVGLTPEQMERIRQLNARCRSEMTHPESALAEQKRKLRQLWLEPEPAPERIEPLQRSVRTLRGEIREKRSRHRGDILETLTPEQRDQLTPYGRPAHRHPAR